MISCRKKEDCTTENCDIAIGNQYWQLCHKSYKKNHKLEFLKKSVESLINLSSNFKADFH